MGEFEERPQPDPSPITTQVIWREIASLKELVFSKIEGMEKAIEVAHEDLVRVPTEVQRAVGTLKELHEEKFNSIQKQFEERDVRAEQTSKDSKVAVDAALQAQKEAAAAQNASNAAAITKSEAATTKQMDQLATTFQQITKGFETAINDLKDRMTRGEGRGEGSDKKQTDTRMSNGVWIALVGLAIAAAMLAIAFTRGN